MRNDFSVSYCIVTQESAAEGDFAESGWIAKNCGLREAISGVSDTRTAEVGGVECVEADERPLCEARSVTITNGMEYRTGAQESRTLHMPESLTPSTRRRIARLLGVKS
jgi:hypothetical protein